MQLWALFPLIDQRRQLLSYAGKPSAPPLLLRWRRSIAIAAAAIATATALAAALAAALTPAIPSATLATTLATPTIAPT